MIPLFLLLCIAITIANYLPIYKGKPFFALFKNLPANHISTFTDKGVMNITGIIASKPETLQISNSNSKKRVRFALSVESITDIKDRTTKKLPEKLQNKKSGMIQINIYQPSTEFRQGDTIRFKGIIKGLRNFNNPGGFDYVQYMYNKNLWGRINLNGKDVFLLNSHRKQITHKSHNLNIISIHDDIIDKINSLKDNFTKHILNNTYGKESGAILCALTIGNKEFISKELNQVFSKTGASHILAISGLHLSIVAIIFFYIFNLLLSFSQQLLIRGWSKKGAAILTILPIVFYALISGFSDATQRAMIMVIIFMVASVIERESNTFNSLAASGILILLFDPMSLFMVSFQLSFLAVFFILMGLSIFEQYKFEIKTRFEKLAQNSCIKINLLFKNSFIQIMISLIFISLCASAGTQILVMRYFNIFSFSGVIVNLVLIPFVGFGALSLGLASLILYPFSVEISGFLIRCSDLILTPCIIFIKTIADNPLSYIETFTPDLVEITCYYFFMLSLFIAAKSWKQQNHPKEQASEEIDSEAISLWQKRLNKKEFEKKERTIFFRLGIAGLFLSLFIFIINELVWINKRFFNNNLSVTALDVGQGNSALIEMPKGKTILVDGGGFAYSGIFDTGENIIAPFLRYKKIMTLDLVILTHPDADHLNGLIYIVDHFKVKQFIKNCDKLQSTNYKKLMAGITKNGSQIFIIGETLRFNKQVSIKIGNGEIQFFHPTQPCLNSSQYFDKHSNNSGYSEYLQHLEKANGSRTDYKHINDNSLVFKVIFKKTSLLFPGDITMEAEHKIANKYGNLLKSDILIAPHHGSDSSSSDFFLDKIKPQSIIISCGWKNQFGFPKNGVIKNYLKRGIKIFRTDLNGSINITSNGSQWKISPFL